MDMQHDRSQKPEGILSRPAPEIEQISRIPGAGIGIGVATGIDTDMSTDSDLDPESDADTHADEPKPLMS